ncbi:MULTISPECIES: hypothetical protein [Streptomyces]|uniref:Uncharacterized protein n=1 Tax=Streptomyces odorifer TaxID=53450 RepID=A0A7Y6CBK0_9ACTN|nr:MULTISPECIES: hypothetical protein [Streptomyces]NUV33230.1 hypothetical protein [Streptomyces sp. KAI-27]NUV46918.1 hypothetical protein [Streptomyces sp. CAI-78]MBL0775927.1 hypothetical protein [Streptomyces albidoflavus]MBL0801212.1 hypothetical protein [Streptomyces albidoflavus]MBV1957818.1 hypothetical protein [Streptomyces sp. BV333]
MSRLPAACLHTHLFRGARVLVDGVDDPSGYARAPRPLELALRFSDGAPADAEVLVSPESGETVLAVGAYTTEAGTFLSSRSWLVSGVAARDAGVELSIGVRVG